jgi:peptidyl-prolyl cis-trans isomerase-like protein 2
LAKRSQGEHPAKAPAKQQGDAINWFGVKVGAETSSSTADKGTTGVGKYLNLKRPTEGGRSASEPSKKRKVGFGDFDAW